MVDVSRNVVAGLLVLVILVSGFGMYYALWGVQRPAAEVNGPNGQVRLAISHGAQESAAQSSTAGQVVLTVPAQGSS